MKVFKTGLMVLVAFTAFVVPAKADYFAWEDAKTGAKLTYPDTWKQINNQQPDDLITLSIPSFNPPQDEDAVCRLRAREDKRFMIYPNRFRPDVRDLNFNNDFWKDYTAGYDEVHMIRQQNEAGLGQGYASMTLISYLTPADELTADKDTQQHRGGLMAVTNYGDKVYIAECSSTVESYPEYHQLFLSLFKSISFKPAYTVTKVGGYFHNFLNDWGTIDVALPNTKSRTVY